MAAFGKGLSTILIYEHVVKKIKIMAKGAVPLNVADTFIRLGCNLIDFEGCLGNG